MHESEAACTVDGTAGQGIACTLEVRGALPLFTFACMHHSALAAPSGAPSSRYEWSTYDVANSRGGGDMHVLTLRFSGGAVWYRFRMELIDRSKAAIKIVKDVEYESIDPTDVAEEPIRLRTK